MNKPPIRLFLTLAACVLLAGPAQGGKYYFQVNGGYSSYNLDDINDAVDRTNAQEGMDIFSSVHSGWNAGLGAGYLLGEEMGVGLAFERLACGTQYSDGSHSGDFDLPANLYKIFVDYLPTRGNKVKVGAGAATGLISSAASYQESDPAASLNETMDFDGTGFLFEAYVVVSSDLSSKWDLFGQGGFRHALVGQVQVDGETIYNPDSLDDKLRLNYSGIFLRLGLKFQP